MSDITDSRDVGRWPSESQTDLILKYLSDIIELLEEIRDQGKAKGAKAPTLGPFMGGTTE